MIDLTNKIGVVTGAASGIGQRCALTFARYGASIILVDITETQGLETLDMVRKLGATAEFVAADVSTADQVNQIETLARDRFGGIDFAVNAAGIPGRMSS